VRRAAAWWARWAAAPPAISSRWAHGLEAVAAVEAAVGRQLLDDVICCFARLIRCANVFSGTRNAWFISAVLRPPTARSASAICDAGVSAGWQHMNSRISPSWASVGGGPAPAAGAAKSAGRTHEWTSSSRG